MASGSKPFPSTPAECLLQPVASVSGLPTAFGDLRSVFRKVGASLFPPCLGHVLGTHYRPCPQAGRLSQASPVGFPVFSRSAPRAAQPGGRSLHESPRPSQPEGRPNGKQGDAYRVPCISDIFPPLPAVFPKTRGIGFACAAGAAGAAVGLEPTRGRREGAETPAGGEGCLPPASFPFSPALLDPRAATCIPQAPGPPRDPRRRTFRSSTAPRGLGFPGGRGRHQLEVGSTGRSREARGGPGWEPRGARTVSWGVGWRRVCGTDVHGLGNRDPPGRVRVVAPAPQGRRRGRETQLSSWTLRRGVRDFSGGRKERRKWHRGMLR